MSGYHIVRILSENAYELMKPNGKTFKVNVHHIRPFGKIATKRNEKRICNKSSPKWNLRDRQNIRPLVKLTYT